LSGGAKTLGILYRLEIATPRERALILGALAVVSALLSWCLATPRFLVIRDTPLPPALWFGLVLCFGVALWASHNLLRIFVVLLSCFLAWTVAVETTLYLQHSAKMYIRGISRPGPPVLEFVLPITDYLWGVCGMVGGFLGSVIVVLVISAALPAFRKSGSRRRTILLGTLAGVFLEAIVTPSEEGLTIHLQSLLPVFLAWQISVAASIGYGLTPQRAATPRPDPTS
jgi:hypothetical protein